MKLVFCSCSKIQSVSEQPTWARIQAERPDAVLLLGDTVYLDHDQHVDAAKLGADLRNNYRLQHAEPNFTALMKDLAARGAPVFSIYDDHDFLGNNRYGGDHDPALREMARAELIRALAPPMTGEDVYSATQLGDVLLLVLDVRFYRTTPAVSQHSRDAIMGATQWQWLENQVAGAGASKYIVIASSTTFHSFADESWEQYSAAFDRLRALIGMRKGAMVLSGDIHRNDSYDDSGVLELVSSGVSRRGIVFGGLRENFGVLNFDAAGADVKFLGNKPRDRMSFRIELADWKL